MRRTASSAALMLLLAACGGSGDRFDEAVDRANEQEDKAVSLGVTSPCADVSQCGRLEFGPTSADCNDLPTYRPYSLMSPTAAAASAAAARQRELAAQAVVLAPRSYAACPAVFTPPSALVCAANTCGQDAGH